MTSVIFLTIQSAWVFIVTHILLVEALPFLKLHSRDPTIVWNAPPDTWNLETPLRSIRPHFEVKQFANRTQPTLSDDEFLQQMRQFKEDRSEEDNFHPHLLGKLLHWNDITYDIKNVAIPCTFCKAGIGMILHKVKKGKSDAEITKLVTDFCIVLKLQSRRVCEGLANLYAHDVCYVLRHIKTDPHEVCSFFLGDVCEGQFDEKHEWQVTFPPVIKPPVTTDFPIPKEGAPYFKVLHLSDNHYDPYYKEGSNALCGEPLCCRDSSGVPANNEAAAGKWGDYRKCDTPKRTVDSMFNHINQTHKDIDYIIWTGDLIPHDIWNQTKSLNLNLVKNAVKQLSESFPGVPIFPALGNHETAPVDNFPPPFIDQPDYAITWLYEELAKLWKRWLPDSATETIRRGAFYSVLLRPGFRIISLNTNYCVQRNWWLLLNSTDPATELQWLIYELQNAERSNEKVHIIGHVPPGDADCLKVWSRNFYDIIARFERTVVAQFYGHTHNDEFEVFYDPKNWTHATSIAYIGPSVTPYENLNPGYRIYYVDGDHVDTTRLVIDHETWVMNLKEANLRNVDEPNWYKLYTARAAYDMPALRPTDWNEVVKQLSVDNAVFDKYYKYYWKDSPMRPHCEETCRKRIICNSKSGRSHDRKQFCAELEPKSLLLRGIDKGVAAVESTLTLFKDIF